MKSQYLDFLQFFTAVGAFKKQKMQISWCEFTTGSPQKELIGFRAPFSGSIAGGRKKKVRKRMQQARAEETKKREAQANYRQTCPLIKISQHFNLPCFMQFLCSLFFMFFFRLQFLRRAQEARRKTEN
jgi:hypothetical protein